MTKEDTIEDYSKRTLVEITSTCKLNGEQKAKAIRTHILSQMKEKEYPCSEYDEGRNQAIKDLRKVIGEGSGDCTCAEVNCGTILPITEEKIAETIGKSFRYDGNGDIIGCDLEEAAKAIIKDLKEVTDD